VVIEANQSRVAIGANQSQVVRALHNYAKYDIRDPQYIIISIAGSRAEIITRYIKSIRLVSSRAREDSQHPSRLLFPTANDVLL